MKSSKSTILTKDGYYLRGTVYEPLSDKARQQVVIVNGATGVLQRYYQPFAEYLQSQGFTVLTYDFRGIGESRKHEPRAPAPTMLHWGERDMDTVLTWAQNNYPGYRVQGVGHSIGGQLMGVLPGNNRYEAFLGIASQHIYWRNWPTLTTRMKSLAFFGCILPLFYNTTGSLPPWVLGAERLPKGVAKDWGRFGRYKHYLSDERGQPIRTGFESYQGRLKLCAISDDEMFAPEPCVRKLGGLFTSTRPEVHVLQPQSYGMKKIDHFGFFKKNMNQKAWEEAANWLSVA